MKLFVLLSRVPFPLEKGDRLRAYHQLKQLHTQHTIFLCCLSDETVTEEQRTAVEAICSRLEIVKINKVGIVWSLAKGLFSKKPFQVHYFHQRAAHRKVNRWVDEFSPDHIYCQLIRTSEYLKRQFEIPKTIDYMDALSMGMKRRIKDAPWYKRELVRMEWQRLQDYENLIFDYFDNHVIISEQDKQLIIHPKRSQIEVIPNGVDSSFFSPMEVDQSYDLVFTGNMSYAPNVAAAEYLCKIILPLVVAKRGGCSVLLAGVNPHPRVKALASDAVKVSGWMEDIREAYASGKVFVAPLQIGTGQQNKLLEAMSMGKACVTSTLVNNALGAEDEKHLFVCQNPEEYAVKIHTLLENESLRNTVGQKGRDHVKSTFSWEATSANLSRVFQ